MNYYTIYYDVSAFRIVYEQFDNSFTIMELLISTLKIYQIKFKHLNSLKGISNHEDFNGRLKLDITISCLILSLDN